MDNEDNCKCGKESTRGCHGFMDGEIYNEYYCDECYNRKDSLEEKENEPTVLSDNPL
jgi:hypothetical protein